MKKLLLLFIFSIACFKIYCQLDTMSTEGSITYYNSILKKNKHSGFANYGLSCIYYSQADYKKAEMYSSVNLKADNDYSADSYIIYTCSLEKLGRPEKAFSSLESAITKYPENYKLLYQYAFLKYLYRQYPDALKALDKVISVNPIFAPAHYLYGISLFEKDNDKQSVIPFIYALLLDTVTERSKNSIVFITNYLNKKFDNIQIPFFEKRSKLSVVDDILTFYSSSKTDETKKIDLEQLLILIDTYLKDQDVLNNSIYSGFFKKLNESKNLNTFMYAILKSYDSEYINRWYFEHSKDLEQLAAFLEKNMIEKK